MAAELTLRLNDAREVSPNLWPRTIALSTRQGRRDYICPLAFRYSTVDATGDALIRLERDAEKAGTVPVCAECDDRYRRSCRR